MMTGLFHSLPLGHSPSSYVMYQFYTFPDHDTVIVANSQNPDYHDTKCFVVAMNPHLHSYLTSAVSFPLQPQWCVNAVGFFDGFRNLFTKKKPKLAY